MYIDIKWSVTYFTELSTEPKKKDIKTENLTMPQRAEKSFNELQATENVRST